MNAKPILSESAAPARSTRWRRSTGESEFPDHILRSEEFAACGGDLFALYEAMEEKDGHLFSVLQTRKNGVLARERHLHPASEGESDRAVADYVGEILDGIPNFSRTLQNILDALGKGFSVQEILWQIREDGRIGIAEIKSRYPGRFLFDEQGRLCLSTLPGNIRAMQFSGHSPQPLPERKFLVCTFGGQYSNIYGKGLLARAFWYYWFKKNNIRFWMYYNDRYGSPTAVAHCSAGVPEDERTRLLEVLESLQSDTGIVLPENVTLEFIESRNGAAAATYRDFADWCNDEVSKIVLGQTLTTTEGRRSGSLALGRIHDQVRSEYVESDAHDLMEVINGQLIPWIVQYNFPPGTPCPRWIIDTSADEDLDREIEIDKRLLGLGVPLSSEYFYERYRRPAPRSFERALRYDDQNLFQYHMKFGVLTVNEVRERLGLPPVAWGAERVRILDDSEQPAEPNSEEPQPNPTEDDPEKQPK